MLKSENESKLNVFVLKGLKLCYCAEMSQYQQSVTSSWSQEQW